MDGIKRRALIMATGAVCMAGLQPGAGEAGADPPPPPPGTVEPGPAWPPPPSPDWPYCPPSFIRSGDKCVPDMTVWMP